MTDESAAAAQTVPAHPRAASQRVRGCFLAPGRGLALCGLMLAGAALLLAVAGPVAAIGVAVLGSGQHFLRNLALAVPGLAALLFLLPWPLRAARGLAAVTGRLAGAWCGVPIAEPRRPVPGSGPGLAWQQRLRWLLADRATWQDLRWLAVNAAGGWVLAAAPAALILSGLLGAAAPYRLHQAGLLPAFAIPAGQGRVLAGLGLPVLGLAAGPRLLRAYGLLAQRLLGPGRRAEPAGRAHRAARQRSRVRPWLLAPARGLVLWALMQAEVGLVLALPLAMGGPLHIPLDSPRGFLIGAVLGLLLFPALVAILRRLNGLIRRLAGSWCGVPVAEPYRPRPAGPAVTIRHRYRHLWQDPATWRDLLWLLVNAAGGWVLAVLPAVLIGLGLAEFIVPALYNGAPAPIPPPAFPGNAPAVLTLLGVALIATGFAAGPRLLRAYGLLARALLGPTGNAALAERVQHLSQTRAETIDAGAAEMRRIERDLHDGAQARLVAMGMTLDAAGQLIGTDPDAARALVLEARDASARALAELRDLVRGIHPPVLADRGLADAIRALALDSPQRVTVAGALPGRPPLPVESAAYFGVSELLANVAKHAGARQAWVGICHDGEMLRISVTDDGCGGADPARGTGLRGIERRVAAFDGVAAVTSPPGGPTVVTMEIPCALSSPKTSSC